jgi:hypothetical protein
VTLRAEIRQDSYVPGAEVVVDAALAQSGLPVTRDPAVWVEINRPDGEVGRLALDSTSPGEFSGAFATTTPGVYRLRVRARGRTRTGLPFTRERLATAAVWYGDQVDGGRRP